jgi:PIN domain nuclease of toxin-antitoxin system
VRILIDTHVFLWWTTADPRLPSRVKTRLLNPDNILLLSVASVWEIAIKVHRGKLHLPEKLNTYFSMRLAAYRIDALPVTAEHVIETASLLAHHGDPFDRLIIAQARLERVPILTADEHFRKYSVEVIW